MVATMALYDTYGGPEAWDRYCERQDELAAAAKWGQECGTCSHCFQPGDTGEFKGYPPIGWCDWMDEFVNPENHPGDYDCDSWTDS